MSDREFETVRLRRIKEIAEKVMRDFLRTHPDGRVVPKIWNYSPQ